MTKWDIGRDGNVILCPMTSYTIAPVADMSCILRIEFLRQTDDRGIVSEAVQLIATPSESLRFAEEIRKTAEALFANPPPPKSERN